MTGEHRCPRRDLLMNVGPTARGTFDERASTRLTPMASGWPCTATPSMAAHRASSLSHWTAGLPRRATRYTCTSSHGRSSICTSRAWETRSPSRASSTIAARSAKASRLDLPPVELGRQHARARGYPSSSRTSSCPSSSWSSRASHSPSRTGPSSPTGYLTRERRHCAVPPLWHRPGLDPPTFLLHTAGLPTHSRTVCRSRSR